MGSPEDSAHIYIRPPFPRSNPQNSLAHLPNPSRSNTTLLSPPSYSISMSTSHSSPTSFFKAAIPKMTGPLPTPTVEGFQPNCTHLYSTFQIPGYVVPSHSDPANIWAPLSTDNLHIHQPSPQMHLTLAFSLQTPPPHPQLPSHNDRMGPLDNQADRFLEMIRQNLIKEENLKRAITSH